MLRTLQKKRVRKMLESAESFFKVLILDESTQSILSPLLRLSDLRECGVTCHFLIDSKRDPISDAAAFYFISSGDALLSEMQTDPYAGYFLNSSTSFRRKQLEGIALRASEKQIANKVKSVFDQFLHFVSLQDSLFSLNISDSYLLMEETAVIREAVSGLVSVAVTFGEMPFILSDGSEVAMMLDQQIRSSKLLKGGVKRPLFIILNRNFDIFTPIRHVTGYVELIHDVLGIKANRVAVGPETNYELDVDSEFYKTNAFVDFPIVAEVVERELKEYKKEMALRCVDDRSSAEEIQKALESAPHLQKRNEIISSNLNICMEVVKIIKERILDDFYNLENNLDRECIETLLGRGRDEDKLRCGLTLLRNGNTELGERFLASINGTRPEIMDYFRRATNQGGRLSGLREKLSSFIFKKSLPVVSMVEEAVSSLRSQEFKTFVTHDPLGHGMFLSEVSRVVVYIHGGATYSEMAALKRLEDTIQLPIILGGSEIVNANEFIKQVTASLIDSQ